MNGLMDAIGQGASAAGYAAGDAFAKQSQIQQQGDVELERQKRLEEFKAGLSLQTKQQEADLADQQRVKMVSRIDAKAGDLADQQLAPTRGLIDSGVDDRRPDRTDDMNRSYDTQRTALKTGLHTEAAIQTGDITPKDAANVEFKNEALVYKGMLEQLREKGRNDRADAQEEGRNQRSDTRMATMLEAIDRRAAARDSKGGEDAKTQRMLDIVKNERLEISSDANKARQLYEDELKAAVGPANKKVVQDKWQPKFDQLERKRQATDSDYDFLRQKVGMPLHTAAPAPAPAAPPAAPPKPPAAPGAPAAKRPPLSSFQK